MPWATRSLASSSSSCTTCQAHRMRLKQRGCYEDLPGAKLSMFDQAALSFADAVGISVPQQS